MKPNIGITEKNTEAVANYLQKLLADEFVLYTKTKNAHWNIEGADFYDVHKFFEAQFGQIDEITDNIAERIRAIGHYTASSLKNFLSLTHLSEVTEHQNDSQGFMRELLESHESIILYIREIITPISDDFKDLGTADFVTGLIVTHEKMAWFLRAHLK